MKKIIFGASFWLISSIAASALDLSEFDLDVNRVNAATFEVIRDHGAGPQQIWCVAADYSKNVLGRFSKTELIIKSPMGPSSSAPGKKGVVFTIDPNEIDVPTKKSYSVTTKTKGIELPVSHAWSFCPEEYISIIHRR